MYKIRPPNGNIFPRWLQCFLIGACFVFTTASFSSDIKNQGNKTGTYSKVYWIKAEPESTHGIFEYFDSVVTPEAKK